MIGKIPKPGKSFGGCVKYNVLKKDTAILFAEGVRRGNIEQTIRDFNIILSIDRSICSLPTCN